VVVMSSRRAPRVTATAPAGIESQPPDQPEAASGKRRKGKGKRSNKVAPAATWTVSEGLPPAAAAAAASSLNGGKAAAEGAPIIVHGVASVGPVQLGKRVVSLAWPHGPDGATTVDESQPWAVTPEPRPAGEAAVHLPGMVPGEEDDAAAATPHDPSVVANPLDLPPRPATTESMLPAEFVLLDDLSLSTGVLWPPFAPQRLVYNVYLAEGTDRTVLKPIAVGAMCSVNDEAVSADGVEVAAAAAVTRVTIRVRSGHGSPVTPYAITMFMVAPSTYEQLEATGEATAVPLHPAPQEPPLPEPRSQFQLYQARMRFDGGAECDTSMRIKPRDVVLVSSTACNNDCGWWGAQGPFGNPAEALVDTSRPFLWVPAMCLGPLDESSVRSPSGTTIEERSVPIGRDGNTLFEMLSLIVAQPQGTQPSVASLHSVVSQLDSTELDHVSAVLKTRQADQDVVAKHQAIHFPYFCIGLAVTLLLCLVGTLGEFGVTRLVDNPLAGPAWRDVARAGGCWPPYLYSGHIYLPVTALVISPGIFSVVYDLVLIWFLMVPQERVYGFKRTVATFLLCGVAGNLTAAVFTPVWISTGPEPGLMGVAAVLGLELLLVKHRRKRHWGDLVLLALAVGGMSVLGGLPGINLWALLGAAIMGFALAFVYSRRLAYADRRRTRTFADDMRAKRRRRKVKIVGAVGAAILVVALVAGFWGGTDGETGWCAACEKACYPVHGWCDAADV